MKIEFELQGVKRTIRFDGYCFHAIDPKSPRVLGYYSSIGNAVLAHVKDAAVPEEAGQEEVIELKELIVRFDKLYGEIRGLSKEDLFGAVVMEGEKRDMSAQQEALKKFHESKPGKVSDIKKATTVKKEPEPEIVPEIEDEDDL